MNIFPYFVAHFISTFSGRPPKYNKWPINGSEPGTTGGLEGYRLVVPQKPHFLKIMIMRHKRTAAKRIVDVVIILADIICTL